MPELWPMYMYHCIPPPYIAGCSPRTPGSHHSSSQCSQCRTPIISQAAQPSHSKTWHVMYYQYIMGELCCGYCDGYVPGD